MSTTIFLDQLKSWAANQQLAKAIHQAIHHLENQSAEIQNALSNLNKKYEQLQTSVLDYGLIDGIAFQDYGVLAQQFYGILKTYEHTTSTADEKNTSTKPPKEPLLVQGKYVSSHQISTNSYRLLIQKMLLLVASILLPAICCLGTSAFFSAGYYDENWAKVYLLLFSGLSVYACLKLWSNWMQFCPKFDDFFQLQLVDSKGKLVKILKEENPPQQKWIPKKANLWADMKKTWYLLFSSYHPNWLIPNTLLKWHLPIAKSLLLCLFPCLLAISCLLFFQTYLNTFFVENTAFFASDLIENTKKLDFIQSYLSVSNTGYWYFSRIIYASSFFILGLVSVAIIGGFLESLKTFLKKHKEILKKIRFIYIFFVALTAFTYSGTKAYEFAEAKNKIAIVQIEFLKSKLDSLVSSLENLLIEEQLIENLAENPEFQEFLEKYDENEKFAQEKKEETENTVVDINTSMSYKWESLKAEDHYFPISYMTLQRHINDIGKQADIYDPNRPNSPKPPEPEPPIPPKSKTYKFSSKNAASIWEIHQENINLENLEKLRKEVAQKKKKWNDKVKKWNKEKKFVSKFLKPYLNDGTILGFKTGAKTIGKETFMCVVEALSDNPITTAIFRTIYEETIDPKFDIYLKKQVENLVEKKPKTIIPPKKDIVLDDIFDKIEQENNAFATYYESKAGELSTKLNQENKLKAKHERSEIKREQKQASKKILATTDAPVISSSAKSSRGPTNYIPSNRNLSNRPYNNLTEIILKNRKMLTSNRGMDYSNLNNLNLFNSYNNWNIKLDTDMKTKISNKNQNFGCGCPSTSPASQILNGF